MRIALVLTGGLHPSGREQVIPSWLCLVERLAQQHVVHAFTLRHLDEPTTYSLAGATVHDLGRPQGRWAQLRALGRALRGSGPFDVIHAVWVDPSGLAAAIAGRQLGVPAIVTCNSGEFTSLPALDYGLQRHWRGRAVVRMTCRLATRVHVTTHFMEALARQHGHSAIRIPIGADTTQLPATAARIDGPPWRLLQVASLNRVKDHGMLLRALATLRRKVDVRLDLVGEDTLGGSLQAEARALGVSDAVSFHGFVAHDALTPFHARAHLYVQSSRHEAAGMAVLEAAAAGLPVVGTRVGLVSDWAPSAAVAVAPGDQEALASAIERLLQNRTERTAIAERAREFALRHDVDWTAQQFGEMYRSLCGNR